jgi:hypothetical protein
MTEEHRGGRAWPKGRSGWSKEHAEMIDAAVARPTKRGPYKKRAAKAADPSQISN